MNDDWLQLSKKTLHSTPWINFVKGRYKNTRTKYETDYFYCTIPGGSIIYPIDSKKRILLLYCFAPPVCKKFLTPVSGTRQGKEKPVVTARRELIEETGFDAKLEYAGKFNPGPFKSNGEINVFVGTKLRKVAKPILEPTETFSYKWVTLKQLMALVEKNKIENGVLLSSLFIALPKLRKLLE